MKYMLVLICTIVLCGLNVSQVTSRDSSRVIIESEEADSALESDHRGRRQLKKFGGGGGVAGSKGSGKNGRVIDNNGEYKDSDFSDLDAQGKLSPTAPYLLAFAILCYGGTIAYVIRVVVEQRKARMAKEQDRREKLLKQRQRRKYLLDKLEKAELKKKERKKRAKRQQKKKAKVEMEMKALADGQEKKQNKEKVKAEAKAKRKEERMKRKAEKASRKKVDKIQHSEEVQVNDLLTETWETNSEQKMTDSFGSGKKMPYLKAKTQRTERKHKSQQRKRKSKDKLYLQRSGGKADILDLENACRRTKSIDSEDSYQIDKGKTVFNL